MQINSINFGATDPLTLQIANAANHNTVLENELKKDTVEIPEKNKKEAKAPKEKKSLMERFSNFIGTIKKIGVNIGAYTKGTVSGLFKGAGATAATVGVVFTADKIVKGAKVAKEMAKAGEKSSIVKETFKGITAGFKKNCAKGGILETLKTTKGKLALLAGLAVGAFAFVKQIYIARLKSNEKKAMLDHKYVNTPAVGESK